MSNLVLIAFYIRQLDHKNVPSLNFHPLEVINFIFIARIKCYLCMNKCYLQRKKKISEPHQISYIRSFYRETLGLVKRT